MRHTPRLLPFLIAFIIVVLASAQPEKPQPAFQPEEFQPSSPGEKALLQQIADLLGGILPAGPVKAPDQLRLEALKRYLDEYPSGKFHIPAAALTAKALVKLERVPDLIVFAKERLAKEPTGAQAEAAVMLLREHARVTKDPAAAIAVLDELGKSKTPAVAWYGTMGGAQVLHLSGKGKAAQERLEKFPEKDLTPQMQNERDFGLANLIKEQADEASGDEKAKLEERLVGLLDKVIAACEKDPAGNAEMSAAFIVKAHVALAHADPKGAREAYQKVAKLYPGTNEAQEAEMIGPQVELIGQKAPDFEGPGLDGKPVSSKALAGKIAIVDFWATTCPPCVAEAPNVSKVTHDFAKRPFAIVSISLDAPGREDTIKEFLKKTEIDWPQVYEGKGWKSELAAKFHVTAIPSMFMLDENGVVKRIGLRGEELRSALDVELARVEKAKK